MALGGILGAAATVASAFIGGKSGGGQPVGNVRNTDNRTAVTDQARLAYGRKNTIVDGNYIVSRDGDVTYSNALTVVTDSQPALDLADKALDRAGSIAGGAIDGAVQIAGDAIDYAVGVGSDAFELAMDAIEHGGQVVDSALFSNEETTRAALDHTADTFQAALDFADASRAAAFAESRSNTDAALAFADEKTRTESARLMQQVVIVGGTIAGIVAVGFAARKVLQ